KIDLMIYSTIDMRLTERRDDRFYQWRGNRALPYYTDTELAYQIGVQSRIDLLFMQVLKHIPMFVERGEIYREVNIRRTELGNLGMPVGNQVRCWENPGESVDGFLWRVEKDRAQSLSPQVLELLRTARKHGARELVVNVPVMSKHRKKFYSTSQWGAYFS